MVRALAVIWAVVISTVACAQPPARLSPDNPQQNLRLSQIPIHDPFIVPSDKTKTYYLYTASRVRDGGQVRSAVVAYKSKDLARWDGPHLVFTVPDDSWANPRHGAWAPEVHAWRGKYYLFVTLHNRDRIIAEPPDVWRVNHMRGTVVAASDSPDGPFRLLKPDGPHPPADFMTLDGTLYVDPDGQPWMVYAHEWIQVVDGTMEAIRLRDDLSDSVGKPIHLFKASDAPWLNEHVTPSRRERRYVTDGPELFRTKAGRLLMLWSSYGPGGYIQTLARSKSDRLEGPWEQLPPLVKSDSGHGMLFHSFDGRLMMVLHRPFSYPQCRAKLYDMEDTGDRVRVAREREDLDGPAERDSYVWCPDNGDGTYTNPIIDADYSDPDVVRVGDDFYLTASSFSSFPGLPVLHSNDLVNWTIVGHAVPRYPFPEFDAPQHGNGIWAPAIRYHNGEYYIVYGDADHGIFMTKARDPAGPWEPLVCMKQAKGRIDACPFWDDDGQAYLVHAWAKSRAGFNSVLTLCRMSPDGTKLLDEGRLIFDGHENHPTIEGPKMYKRNGYYYIFAPAGGVKPGWQTVLRSKHIDGPYEDRIVLAQGPTDINGPHQGAWIETPAGESWFVHFQDRGPYGRIVHLEPMRWVDDWPVIGIDPDGDGTGQPVHTYAKPDVGRTYPIAVPQTSDEFDGEKLGLEWQWQANPQAEWASLVARPGWIRLAAEPRPEGSANYWPVANLLLQKMPAREFTATTKIDASGLAVGDAAGLVVFGMDYARLTVQRTDAGLRLALVACAGAMDGQRESQEADAAIDVDAVELRVAVRPGAVCQFSYSTDGEHFTPIGKPFTAKEGRWIGAKVGLFCVGDDGPQNRGHADVDWFRVEP